ncbi:tetratricopeptide repeat-containing protein, partial [Mesorhizobium escarrei]|uniref:tetratricopeptide repeat-containing protein n=1 Tax=Mesorhizobium escarrei TaxID=666018 RepID=UPI00345B4E0B
MFGLILEADLVVCDITVHNANVFYELGIRHALRKKGTILIRGAPVADATPFDILTDRYLEYSVDDPGSKLDELTEVIRATLASSRETDSPIFKMLPTLPEVDPAAVHVLPTDFTDEVARAKAAKSAGWLRLLASEVTGQRFQWPALRLIGRAQWELADYVGARRTWLRVREAVPKDLDANFALANLLERQYRGEKRAELLEASNQAIATVLANERSTAAQRAEALALYGRNLKTIWRLDFEALGSVADRRAKATNRNLTSSYEAYRKAYFVDLNHFYSGLAALQMGVIGQELANDPTWEDAFEDSEQAAAYKTELGRQVEALRSSVRIAINAAIDRLGREGKDQVWANISRADLLFLTEERDQRVVQAYRDAVPKTDAFAWDSAKGQLELFAGLRIRAERADRIIREMDAYVEPAKSVPDLNLVVAVGH